MNSKFFLKFVLLPIILIFFTLFLTWVFFWPVEVTELKSPLENNNYSKLTSYDEMIGYIQQLDSITAKIKISDIGQSVEGRQIPALFCTNDETFAANREKKPIALVFCQQHGDEPSGKEAALIVARDLIDDSNRILDKIDLILVPQVNPDGSEMEQRKNANDIDLNRNHVILSEPESNAIHQLFLEWMPEVSLDVHEYNAIDKKYISKGFVKDADEMLGGVTNLNIDPEIMDYSRNNIIPEVGDHLHKDGFSFHRYIVGDPFENKRVRFSTTAINDGRQSMGIYNTFSFILEGKKYGDMINLLERRTKRQVSALMGFLNTISNHAERILELVNSSRLNLEMGNKSKSSHVKMDYFPDSSRDSLTYPVFNLYTWKREKKQFGHFEPQVKSLKSVECPGAYIFSGNEDELKDLLNKHQIKVSSLKNPLDLEVESYSILGVITTKEEDKLSEDIDVLKKNMIKKFSKGDIVVFMSQKAANLIPLLLEPQSNYGIVSKGGGRHLRFKEYLKKNTDYPIYRVKNSSIEELRASIKRMEQ